MPEVRTTSLCIAGGGPAGMMLGVLLARAGIRVTVLEKHADFLRDFRGDTLHPSTLEVMHELGLLERLLARPHQRTPELGLSIGDRDFTLADFSHLPTRCKYIAFMPQWDLLDFLASEGERSPGFSLQMETEVEDLVRERGSVVGVRARTPHGALEIRADLVVGADGRHSNVRRAAALDVETLGAPIDVLWIRLPRRGTDPSRSLSRLGAGRMMVLIDRGDYWQCAYVIPKGSADDVRARGLAWLRTDIAELVPFLSDSVGELVSWDQVKLLTVEVDRLRQWHRRGLLCIGDAAHAMSPVGGVGINLAIQDAVAAANILAEPLAADHVSEHTLAAVQRRRAWPTRATQRIQVLAQDRLVRGILARDTPVTPPFLVRCLDAVPPLRRIPARLIGLGLRPEHVRTASAEGRVGPRTASRT